MPWLLQISIHSHFIWLEAQIQIFGKPTLYHFKALTELDVRDVISLLHNFL